MLPGGVRASSALVHGLREGQELDFHILLQHTVPGRGAARETRAGARLSLEGVCVCVCVYTPGDQGPNVWARGVRGCEDRSFRVRDPAFGCTYGALGGQAWERGLA